MPPSASMIFNHPRRVMDLEPLAHPIRIGVIGLGPRAVNNVIRAVTTYREFRLTAVCDIQSAIVAKVTADLKKNHIKVRGYTDWEKMLATEDLDAVAVQVDPDKQVPICCTALEKGLHVMAEVTLSYSLEECWRLVTTVERTKKIFLLMEQVRYAGFVRAWRAIVKSGVIGRPLFAEGEYFHSSPWGFYRDHRGTNYDPEQVKRVTKAGIKPTWRYFQPPIGYLPHELSPILYILDDRVVRVAGMGTRKHSYKFDDLRYSDTQAALMHTEKDVVLRMAVGFSTTNLPRGMPLYCHWYHLKGTEGVLETPRSANESFKLWVENWHLKEPIPVPWSFDRHDAPPEAGVTGHGGLDYYVFAHFADAVLHDEPLEMDVYKAVETAAPAICAAQSIDQGEVAINIPDFRPGPHRKAGKMPGKRI